MKPIRGDRTFHIDIRAIETMLIDFPTPQHASDAVGRIIASGILPAALEMIDSMVDGSGARHELGLGDGHVER